MEMENWITNSLYFQLKYGVFVLILFYGGKPCLSPGIRKIYNNRPNMQQTQIDSRT